VSRKKKNNKKQAAVPGTLPSEVLFSWLPGRHTAAIAAGLWTAVCFYAYYRRGVSLSLKTWTEFLGLTPLLPVHLVSSLGWNLILLAGMIVLAERVGMIFLKTIGHSESEEGLIRIAVGAGLISLLLLLLGLAGLWLPMILQGFYCGGIAVVGGFWIRDRLSPVEKKGDRQTPKKITFGLFEWTACFLIAATLVLNLLASVVPEIFYDSLVYHLAIPQLYLHRGAIVATPENVYSGLPFALQMLYGWALSLSGENLAVLVHGAFGAATAWGLWMFSRRYASARAGVYAVLMFYVCPITVYAGWHCGVDLGASFYILIALYAIFRSFDQFEESSARSWDVIAGVLAGCATSVKYNVWPVAAALVVGHFILSLRSGRTYRGTARMSIAAAVMLAPWLIKNAVFFGNPIYPFLHEHVGWVQPVDWSGFLKAAGSRDLDGVFSSWRGLGELLMVPWNYSMADRQTDDWPGPAFITLFGWAVFLKWKSSKAESPKPIWWMLPVLAVFAYTSWVLSSGIIRYALSAIALFSLLFSFALEYGKYPSWVKTAGRAVVILTCLFNFQISYRLGFLTGQWKYLKKGWDKSFYLKFQRMSYGLPYFAAMEFIEENTPKDAKVLFLGESRAFYCPRDFVAATLYDTNPFWRIISESKDGEEVYQKVKALGITHVFLSARQMLYRRASPSIFPLDLVKSKPFGEFWDKYLVKGFEDREDGGTDPRWLTVYDVQEPKDGPRLVPENPSRIIMEFLEKGRADGSFR
jgi:hypothetical protein